MIRWPSSRFLNFYFLQTSVTGVVIKALLLGKYCIIMIIFSIKLFLPALSSFYSSVYFRERFLVAVLVEI